MMSCRTTPDLTVICDLVYKNHTRLHDVSMCGVVAAVACTCTVLVSSIGVSLWHVLVMGWGAAWFGLTCVVRVWALLCERCDWDVAGQDCHPLRTQNPWAIGHVQNCA